MIRSAITLPARRPTSRICQLCVSAPARFSHTAKTRNTSLIVGPSQNTNGLRNFGLKQGTLALRSGQKQLSTGAVLRQSQGQRENASAERGATAAQEGAPRDMPDFDKLIDLVQKSKDRFLSTDGIPVNQLVLAALRTCQGAANALHPFLSQTKKRSTRPESTASHLMSLDSNGGASTTAGNAATNSKYNPEVAALLQDAVSAVSESAFAIIAHPPVEITPQILELYVSIQARLGRPETLPHVFELYASKPKPKIVDGSVEYVKQNPNRADKAIEEATAKTALGATMEAKNLDAALGVIECCYANQAFIRQKFLRQLMFPASVLGITPFAVYALASAMSRFQNTVEPSTATKYAFACIVAYLGFTSTIGLVAKVTSNDHMKRVTWAPGLPLHQRWIREEERAALDEVACAWGFKEKARHGEEGGVEWEALREYVGLKGMILDRVELMDGMT